MNPPERRSAPAPQLSPAADEVPDVASAGILPGRRRQKPTRAQIALFAPLLTLAAFFLTAAPVAAFSYAVAASGAPLLVGPRGPADESTRLQALVVGLVFVVLIGVLSRMAFVRWLAAPFVVIDTEGVWLGRGRQRSQGLAWSEIAAVDIVGEEPPRIPEQVRIPARGTGKQAPVVRAGLVRKPFVDLYPVAKISEEPGTPLGSRVVTAQPSAPGLRGRRYVVELAAPSEDVAALGRALERHAPAKRLTPS